MKKLLVALILFGMLFSQYFKIGDKVVMKELGNGRLEPKKSGAWHMYLCPGCVFSVANVYGDYLYVKVTKGSDNVGKEGFVWAKRVANGKIIEEGVCLRSTPKKYEGPKDKNVICTVRVGAEVEVLYTATTWIEVTGSCVPRELWVWAGNAREAMLEEK